MAGKIVSFATLLMSLAAIAQAQPDGTCSSARLAGAWGYTYTGALILPTGAVPAGSVGRFTVDAAGNLSGTQTSSVGGSVGEDTIAGSVAVNSDCTGTATVRIYSSSGTLLRTAVLALVFVDNAREFRAIFQSLVLANGTNVPAVMTMDGKKLIPGRGNEQ
jgi:hypothetical protein